MKWHSIPHLLETVRAAVRPVSVSALVLSVAMAMWMVLALMAAWPSLALADIYKCTDSEGLITFTDSPSRKFRACELLYRDPPPPAPAPTPAPAPRAAGAKPSAPPPATAGKPIGQSEAAGARANPGPANFPRVDQTEQRDRDLKARQIVELELANERRLLDDARRRLAAIVAVVTDKADPRLREWQDTASRHARNIIEIQRQLTLMK